VDIPIPSFDIDDSYGADMVPYKQSSGFLRPKARHPTPASHSG
jgi:hypothetical protein